MSEKVDATDKEREKHIKKDMHEMKQRYETVNEKLWNLETRMDTMSRDQAESSCAIQSKLDALLRNSTAQEKLVTDRPQGTRVDFVEPQRNKREYTTDISEHPGRGVQDHHERWTLKHHECTRGLEHKH